MKKKMQWYLGFRLFGSMKIAYVGPIIGSRATVRKLRLLLKKFNAKLRFSTSGLLPEDGSLDGLVRSPADLLREILAFLEGKMTGTAASSVGSDTFSAGFDIQDKCQICGLIREAEAIKTLIKTVNSR